MLDILLTGRYPLVELQDDLGVKPTKAEKKASGKYGHVRGITYLIQNARLLGWPVHVIDINHVTWVFLPQHVMDEENLTS